MLVSWCDGQSESRHIRRRREVVCSSARTILAAAKGSQELVRLAYICPPLNPSARERRPEGAARACDCHFHCKRNLMAPVKGRLLALRKPAALWMSGSCPGRSTAAELTRYSRYCPLPFIPLRSDPLTFIPLRSGASATLTVSQARAGTSLRAERTASIPQT